MPKIKSGLSNLDLNGSNPNLTLAAFMVDIITKDLLLAYKEDELFLKQKSRDKWLVFGDRSSKFFHDYVKTNRSKNQLLKLKDKNNKDQWSDGAKAEVAVGYFSEHFISSNPSSYEPAFASFLPRVSGEMNKQLTRQISKDEVTHAIFSICADSALGPDGMTAAFFKIIGGFWEIKLPQRYRKSSDQGPCLGNGISHTFVSYRRYQIPTS